MNVTRRAEQIREETGMAWEYACLQAERERDYVAAYRNVIDAVCDVRKYVSPSLAAQVAALEAGIPADRIETLRDIAQGY